MSYKLPKIPHQILMAYFAYIIVMLIWSLAGPVIKLTLEYIPPFTFLFIRFALVTLIMLPFTVIMLKKTPIHKNDYLNIFLLGLLNILNLMFIFWGLKYTSAIDYAVISIIGPIMLIAAGHYFFNEKVNNWVKLGVLLATVGTLYVAFEPIIEAKGSFDIQSDITQRLLGNFLILLAQTTFAAYIIWSKATTGEKSKVLNQTLKFIDLKPMHKSYTPNLLTAINFYTGFLALIPFAFAESLGYFGPYSFEMSQMTLIPTIGLLYMVIFSSIVAYMLFQWALSKSMVEDNAIFTYLHPIFSVPFAFLLLNEIPSKTVIIGTVFIVLGVVIAETKKT